MKAGVLFRWASFWVGMHYSFACKRICVNLLPCITFWVILPGGLPPKKQLM
jgi:hypothetical protein